MGRKKQSTDDLKQITLPGGKKVWGEKEDPDGNWMRNMGLTKASLKINPDKKKKKKA